MLFLTVAVIRNTLPDKVGAHNDHQVTAHFLCLLWSHNGCEKLDGCAYDGDP